MTDSITINYNKSEDLKIYLQMPKERGTDRPVILFFHGAGFTTNKVNASQFQQHANYFTSLGFVTIRVEYRPLDIEGLFSPIECLKNAKSAIRWTKQNSIQYGIDSNKLIAVGASAGGYLCLCVAMIDQINNKEDDVLVSPKPNAMILLNGGVNSNLLIDLFPEMKDQLLIASPTEVTRKGLPPSLFFHGTEDQNIPIEDVINFSDDMRVKGNYSRVIAFEGLGHGFFNYGNHDNKPYDKILRDINEFLREIDLLG
ncbi:alpha/beta hydrolase [Cohnella suwonensis]|uniref:Alpha/beta hydrolase n=1 Tax=Cohnella suwonensis TaxID=696072 RepID=A0ABW0LZS8_9BACL